MFRAFFDRWFGGTKQGCGELRIVPITTNNPTTGYSRLVCTTLSKNGGVVCYRVQC